MEGGRGSCWRKGRASDWRDREERKRSSLQLDLPPLTHTLAASCRYECERAGGESASPTAWGDKKTDKGSIEKRKEKQTFLQMIFARQSATMRHWDSLSPLWSSSPPPCLWQPDLPLRTHTAASGRCFAFCSAAPSWSEAPRFRRRRGTRLPRQRSGPAPPSSCSRTSRPKFRHRRRHDRRRIRQTVRLPGPPATTQVSPAVGPVKVRVPLYTVKHLKHFKNSFF